MSGRRRRMPKADKVATVAEITDKFRSSSAAVVTEYRGLTMAQLTELRRSLGKDTAYTVAKNTLVKRAAADAGVTGLDDMFVGPTAVAFIGGEPVDAAKALRDFAKTHPLLVIKGGLLDGRKIEPAEVSKLADLESGDVLLAKMAGAMLTKAAYVFNALPSQVARLAAALQDKRIADGEVLEAAPSAETADDTAVVAAAEAVVADEADEVAKEIITAEGAAAEAAEIEAEVETVEEIVVAEVVAEQAVAVELAEEIAVIEEVAEEAIAEAPDEAAVEEVLAEAGVAEAVAIEAAAEDIAVIETVADELAEAVLTADQ